MNPGDGGPSNGLLTGNPGETSMGRMESAPVNGDCILKGTYLYDILLPATVTCAVVDYVDSPDRYIPISVTMR